MVLLVGVIFFSVLFATVFRNLIKRFPVVFYLLAIALNLFVLLANTAEYPRIVQMFLFNPVQRNYFALGFFIVVMFIGVFKSGSRASAYFSPIRAELSIMACFLSLAHIVRHIAIYVPNLFQISSTSMANVYVSVIFGLCLTVLLIILGVTSFRVVKTRMSTALWKKIQLLAYPFFLLIYVHVGIILLPSMASGGFVAFENFIIYSLIFISYSVLRVRKALNDRSAKATVPSES